MCDAPDCGTMVQYFGKAEEGQLNFGMGEHFHHRLREERVRLAPKQADFASKLGVRQSQLSEWEKGSTGLKIDHMALLAAAGIDILYVVTGHRGGEQLALRESAPLSQFRSLDDIGQCTVLPTAAQMVSAAGQHFTPRHVIQALLDDLAMSAQEGASPEVLDPRTGAAGYLAGLHDQQREYKGEE